MADDGVQPGRLLRHQRLLVVVELPAVPREPLRRRRRPCPERRCSTSCATTSTTPASSSRSSTRCWPRWPTLPDDVRDGAHLVFVTHSIPTAMAETAGPRRRAPTSPSTSTSPPRSPRGSPRRPGVAHPHELVYCSRSGPPQVPWLEPDVNDHLEALAADGVPAVVMVPVGFVSDHMEVIYDLDTEALAHRGAARPAGPPGRDRRAPTRGSWRWSATCWSSGPRSSAARRWSGASVGVVRPAVGPLPGGLLPQPARRAAGPVRGADMTADQPRRAARAGGGHRPLGAHG